MTTQAVLNYASINSPVIFHQGKVIRLGELLRTVDYLARKIPPHQYLLNLYEDRYYFLLGFLVGIKQGSISLFPSTVTPHVMAQLKESYGDILVLSNAKSANDKQANEKISKDLQTCDLQSLLQGKEQDNNNPVQLDDLDVLAILPELELSREIAIIFTSGSTGQPKPYVKQWGDLVLVSRLLAEKFLSDTEHSKLCAILATVPAQHMYGMESSIMLALQNGLLIHAEKPFFPQDIKHCLEDLSQVAKQNDQLIATTIITTPLHLKACIKTGIELSGVQQFISATAPLQTELAQLCESNYGARVMEIFGCTEVGSMAWRRTIDSEQWSVLSDITLTAIEDVDSDYKEVRINTTRSIKQFLFNDVIELLDEQHFILKGRKEDLINLAGKRTSLAYLNHHLQSYNALQDGCFYQDSSVPESRLVAFVVLQTVDEQTNKQTETNAIRDFLKDKIESVFLPKKIYFVDSLPRNATGKLPLSELQEMMLLNEYSFGKAMLIEQTHPSLAGHFPGNPIVPGVVILDHVINKWQKKTRKTVQQILNAKFVHLLKPDIQCNIRYQARKNNKVDFVIMDATQTMIAKGLFSF